MSQQWNANNPAPEEEVQMPLGAGEQGAPAEEFAGSGSASRLKVNTSTIALIAAFAAALVVLYLLGLQNKPRAASAQEQKHAQELEEKINHMLNSKQDQQKVGDFLRDTPKLLERLNNYFDSGATTQDLPGNPFEHESARPAETAPGAKPLITHPGDDPEKTRRLLAISEELGALKVTAIFVGNPSAALINNHMVTVGSSFKYLKVTSIQSDRVLLSADGDTYELKVAGQQPGK
jgi:hypothetical protein